MPCRCGAPRWPVRSMTSRPARLDLWSLVRVTDDNGDWMRLLLAAAAVMQFAEARLDGAAAGRSRRCAGPPPVNTRRAARGPSPTRWPLPHRSSPSSGDAPCAWTGRRIPGRRARLGRSGPRRRRGRAASPRSSRSATDLACRIAGRPAASAVRQRTACPAELPGDRVSGSTDSESEGVKLALSLNAADSHPPTERLRPGQLCLRRRRDPLQRFVPNALHKTGAAEQPLLFLRRPRAGWRRSSSTASGTPRPIRSTPRSWPAGAQQRQAAAPVVERPMQGCPMMRARAGGN